MITGILIGTKPLHEPIFSNKISWNLNEIPIQENVHENALCKWRHAVKYWPYIFEVHMEGGILVEFVSRMYTLRQK